MTLEAFTGRSLGGLTASAENIGMRTELDEWFNSLDCPKWGKQGDGKFLFGVGFNRIKDGGVVGETLELDGTDPQQVLKELKAEYEFLTEAE